MINPPAPQPEMTDKVAPQTEQMVDVEQQQPQQWTYNEKSLWFHAWGFRVIHILFLLVAASTVGVSAGYLVKSIGGSDLFYDGVAYGRVVTVIACVFAGLADSWSLRLHRAQSPSLPSTILLDVVALITAGVSLGLQWQPLLFTTLHSGDVFESDFDDALDLQRLGRAWFAMTVVLMACRVASIAMTSVLACTTVKRWEQRRAGGGGKVVEPMRRGCGFGPSFRWEAFCSAVSCNGV
ncbi:hypothetical protein SEUCBS139899_002582 [Sporothrix eucalyptigena]|uniref:CASP-like protein n=1 Tax=Sporothrix eucalyptigena TaxID=1812306 RepID=A0ABP0BJY2_9PEZI